MKNLIVIIASVLVSAVVQAEVKKKNEIVYSSCSSQSRVTNEWDAKVKVQSICVANIVGRSETFFTVVKVTNSNTSSVKTEELWKMDPNDEILLVGSRNQETGLAGFGAVANGLGKIKNLQWNDEGLITKVELQLKTLNVEASAFYRIAHTQSL